MKQVYKDTFDQISISDEAGIKLLQIPSDISSNRKANRHMVIKYVYAMLMIAIISIPTVSVLAANGVDVVSIFRRIFGERTQLVQDNISVPEVKVLSDTFENIDIEITGIAGDKKLIYITMDISKKDGSAFKQGEYEFSDTTIHLKSLNDRLNENKILDFDFLQSTSSLFIPIPDEDAEDNKKSFAYIVNIETEIDEQSYIIPGEEYYLRLSNYDADSEFGKGIWEGEFEANYTEADSYTLELNKVASLPRWGTEEDYNPSTEMLISIIELSPFALRYVCDYDGILGDAEGEKDHDYWHKLYFEMEDGSIFGRDSFEVMINDLLSDNHKGASIFGGGQNDGPFKWRWIFDEPLDVTKVKTIHIGDQAIDFRDYIN